MKIYEKPELEIISLVAEENIAYSDFIEGEVGITSNPF